MEIYSEMRFNVAYQLDSNHYEFYHGDVWGRIWENVETPVYNQVNEIGEKIKDIVYEDR